LIYTVKVSNYCLLSCPVYPATFPIPLMSQLTWVRTRTHTHTHKYVRWTSLPRKMGLPCIARTLVTICPLQLHNTHETEGLKRNQYFTKSSYSQHSCQLVEKQNVMVLFINFWFTKSFPDFPVQGITSLDVSSFWIILDHTRPSKSQDNSLLLLEGHVLSTVLMQDFTSRHSDIRYCDLNRHICILLRSLVKFEVSL